jgi:hypothetical protein
MFVGVSIADTPACISFYVPISTYSRNLSNQSQKRDVYSQIKHSLDGQVHSMLSAYTNRYALSQRGTGLGEFVDSHWGRKRDVRSGQGSG